MSDTKTYPTPEAWAFFEENHQAIRDCCAQFLANPNGKSMMGDFPAKIKFTVDDFDRAVEAKDAVKLFDIFNDAWIRAPESRHVYSIPGFSEMCNLMDGTVDGFIDTDAEYAEDDDE